MLKSDSEISKIGYEDATVKSFDDIVIHYEKEQWFNDEFYKTDYIQVKFHVYQNDCFTLDNLLDPNFIHVKTNSFMNNVVVVYRKLGDSFKQSRFIIYSPWEIKQITVNWDSILVSVSAVPMATRLSRNIF